MLALTILFMLAIVFIKSTKSEPTLDLDRLLASEESFTIRLKSDGEAHYARLITSIRQGTFNVILDTSTNVIFFFIS